MDFSAISLIVLVLVIIVAYITRLNVGLLALAVAIVLARFGGIKDSVMYGGINLNVFWTLIGIYFFGQCMTQSGTLALFAKKHSNAKLVAKVNKIAFNDVIDSFAIDSVVYPKYLTADYILQYVRACQNTIGSNVETLYNILDGRAEALEFSIREASAVTDVPLMDLDLKDNLLICCINRNGTILTPRGQNKIQVGDTVIVVTTNRGLQDIRDILK